MWQQRGQVTLRHVHAARGNRARCGAMGVALASGVNVMLTRLPISHLHHLRPHVSLYRFRPKSAYNFLFSATRRWSRTSLLRCQPHRRDRTCRMRRRSCRCRRGPSAWRRDPAGCAWFPSHAPCGVSASPACSPPVVRARRVPTTSRADEVHGGDTHPPRPPGTRHRPRLFWLLRVPRALWTGTSRSSAAKLQAEGRRCSRGSLPGASSAGGLLTWSRGRRSRAPVGAEDKPAAQAL